MRFTNPTVDRIWLGMIAVAFSIGLPIWVILSVERMGWRLVVITFYLLAVGWWFSRK